MADPDDAVRRSGGDAGQQSGPPLREHLAPGRLAQPQGEELDPVPGADRVTERIAIGSMPRGASSSKSR
jgi:hypothetical protein